MLLRRSAPLDLAELAIRGWVEPVGPLVEAGPEALITLARSDDGVSLDRALEPADLSAPCEVTLEFTRLTPGTHRLQGGALVPGTDARPDPITFGSDADGRGSVIATLDGPTNFTLDGPQ